MATAPDAPEELRPPGLLRTLGVPLAAALLAGWVISAGANEAVFRAVNGWPSVTGDALWANLSVLGEGATMLALSAALIGRRPQLLLAALLAALLATLLLHGLKDLVATPRPGRALGAETIHIIGKSLSKRSFPSGHATTIFAAAALAWSLWRAAAARAAVLVLAVLVAASRLAVGAHWPLDVLAGAALGWLCACSALHVVRRTGWPPATRWQLAVALPTLLASVYVALPDAESPGYELLRPVISLTGLALGLPGLIRIGPYRRVE